MARSDAKRPKMAAMATGRTYVHGSPDRVQGRMGLDLKGGEAGASEVHHLGRSRTFGGPLLGDPSVSALV